MLTCRQRIISSLAREFKPRLTRFVSCPIAGDAWGDGMSYDSGVGTNQVRRPSFPASPCACVFDIAPSQRGMVVYNYFSTGRSGALSVQRRCPKGHGAEPDARLGHGERRRLRKRDRVRLWSRHKPELDRAGSLQRCRYQGHGAEPDAAGECHYAATYASLCPGRLNVEHFGSGVVGIPRKQPIPEAFVSFQLLCVSVIFPHASQGL